MATCLRLVSPNASRSAIKLTSLQKSKWVTRGMAQHMVRGLPYNIDQGLGKFLPPPALRTLVEYQEGLLERLNHELRTDPTAEGHTTVAQTVINYSQRGERTLAFNYAALALNNSFFLDQLSPPPEDASKPNHEDKIDPLLYTQIETNYGDLTHLKSTFSAAAMGIFSNGWIWLVSDNAGNLGVLPTIGPSTLLVRSRMNMHYDPTLPALGEDSVHHAQVTSAPQLPGGDWASAPPSSPASNRGGGKSSFRPFDYQSRTIHTTRALSAIDFSLPTNNMYSEPSTELEPRSSGKSNIMNVGKTLFPLFVVPVYEHAWMSAGYGVWGKEAWLREFWTALDWSKVSNAYKAHIHVVAK